MQIMNLNDLSTILSQLSVKRPVFHSEDDFKFALAWEIKRFYQNENIKIDIRLEYPTINISSKEYIDILVSEDKFSYPIELKYKTKELSVNPNGEQFNLTTHSAYDLACYDSIKDICRIESFINTHTTKSKQGYVIWLTNDKYYWEYAVKSTSNHAAFSIHDGTEKRGKMAWKNNTKAGLTKKRANPLKLKGRYKIKWNDYSDFNCSNGKFKYSLLEVK